MLNKNTEVFMACEADYSEAQTVLFGAPFDSTTSYRPGTRFGSAAIRRESYGVETYSPYQDRDLEEIAVMDSGDLELPFGDPREALSQIEARAAEILADGKRPFLIGGEHLVTLGAVRAAARQYPDLHIVHSDAHADLRDEYLGVQLSHACVLHPLGHPGGICMGRSACGNAEIYIRWAGSADRTAGRETGLFHPRSGRARSLGLSGHRHARAGRRLVRRAARCGDARLLQAECCGLRRERAEPALRSERHFDGRCLQDRPRNAFGLTVRRSNLQEVSSLWEKF